MLPYASKYRFLLNICRYSCVSGRPFLPRSRRTPSTTAASCITHPSWSLTVHRLCPFALWTVISGLQIGRTLPRRLLRALRRHGTRVPQAIPCSLLPYVLARHRRPVRLLECPDRASLPRPRRSAAD